ncbi:MAG TPA: hypothetical protein VFF65_13440 [Phycisphaerales bacterium]|nr:hypothetical protein [Phycisphaerales bacterium]
MHKRAFTVVELLALVAVGGALSVATAAAVRQPRMTSKQVKDGTQLRNIVQGMIIFAQGNKDAYPLPSVFDPNDQTVAEKGRAKDTTGNIMSTMVYSSMISPELLVSPVETNRKIRAHTGYENVNPKAAVNPANALWDPSLSADFTSPSGGHISYAHLQPSAGKDGKPNTGRLARWSCTFNASEALMCNRGPEISSVAYAAAPGPGKDLAEDAATPTYVNAASNTFGFYPAPAAGGAAWSGNVAWNDNHVDFLRAHYKPGKPVDTAAFYTGPRGERKPDMAFFDEPDDGALSNNFLGLFVKAGNRPADFKPIWD